MIRICRLIMCFTSIYIATSCKKSEFLDRKPDERIFEPSTLEDLQSILDNYIFMNGGTFRDRGIEPVFFNLSTDDFYTNSINIESQPNPVFQSVYVWGDNIYTDNSDPTWNLLYASLFYTNVVIDGIKDIERNLENSSQFDNVLGSSLFFRGKIFYNLSQLYAPPYSESVLNSGLGCILKLDPDVNEVIKRSTVQQTYDQILNDLKASINCLPIVSSSPFKTRPTKQAAYAMIAKTYLSMRKYDLAKVYADSCLSLQNNLLKYSLLSNVDPFPFERGNSEVILHSMLSTEYAAVLVPANAIIDSNLFNDYDDKDLRKSLFFRPLPSGGYGFKGSYDGSGWYFSGLAVDEVYLIRAECNARMGNVKDALSDLNHLLKSRWTDDGSFYEVKAENSLDALDIILRERRKELIMRGTRWADLRRLNIEGRNIVIKRILKGAEYELLPNDKRYTLLIPPNVMRFNPELQQNPR